MIPQNLLDAASLDAFKKGIRVLQGHRLLPGDKAHVDALLAYYRFPFGYKILDAGSGFGEVARLMHKGRPDLGFVLLNNNRLQLDLSECDFAKVHSSMEDCPFPDAAFDAVMFNYSLCHMDLDRALEQAARVTKRGGMLAVMDFHRTGGNNDLFAERLFATAHSWWKIESCAASRGWTLMERFEPRTDDQLFRDAYGNDEEYDMIFGDLDLIIWRAVRA